MGDYLIPASWALPVVAASIGVSVEEAQRMIDSGELELTIQSVSRAMLKKDRERFLDAFTSRRPPKKRPRARRS